MQVDERMKIKLFTENYYAGGLDTFIINLVNYWPDQKDELSLVCNEDHPGLSLIEANVKRPLKIVRHSVFTYAQFSYKVRALRLTKILKMLCSPLLPYLFLAYNVIALRRLIMEGNPDRLLIVNGGYPAGDSCRAVAISWGLYSGKPPSIHNFHNRVTKPGWHARLQENIVDRFVARYTDAFVSVSRWCADSMVVRPAIYDGSRVTFIYNGVEVQGDKAETPDRSVREEFGMSAESRLCLMLGTYEARKGHQFLLSAFRKVLDKVPDARLLICGYGFPEEIETVRRIVSDLRLTEAVYLEGFRRDVSSLLEQADLLVVASQEDESFGLTSIEAMAHQVPVLATWVGGVPEVVVNGDGGFCLDKSDVDGYADCMMKILTDDGLRGELGKKGLKRYNDFFTPDKMAAGYAGLIKSMDAQRRKEWRR